MYSKFIDFFKNFPFFLFILHKGFPIFVGIGNFPDFIYRSSHR